MGRTGTRTASAAPSTRRAPSKRLSTPDSTRQLPILARKLTPPEEMMVAALNAAYRTLNDLIADYADTEVRPETVRAARQRIMGGGGTLAYTADTLETIRDALRRVGRLAGPKRRQI